MHHINAAKGRQKALLRDVHSIGPQDREILLLPTCATGHRYGRPHADNHERFSDGEAEVLTATALGDPSIRESSICDSQAQLMDADLAACSPLLPFRTYQAGNVS